MVALWFALRGEKPRARHRVVIVPAFKGSVLVEQKFRASAEPGLDLLGFVDDRPIDSLPSWLPRNRVIGNTGTLLPMIRKGMIDEVVMTIPWTPTARIPRLLVRLSETPVRVSLGEDRWPNVSGSKASLYLGEYRSCGCRIGL